jgi:hypothetical protein
MQVEVENVMVVVVVVVFLLLGVSSERRRQLGKRDIVKILFACDFVPCDVVPRSGNAQRRGAWCILAQQQWYGCFRIGRLPDVSHHWRHLGLLRVRWTRT